MLKVIAVAVAIAATTTVAGAQGTTYKSTAKPATQASTTAKPHKRMKKAESQAALQKEAKISEADARATALKEVPNGSVKSEELEREHGKLIYSYDITVPGKSGIDEVNINAIDGTVVAKQHETPKAERKEAAQEAKEKKTTKK
ncbi:MAG TPA: PepSY domain-containing protein [Gemmatimonadaceae bacterium]|nr:PepSY domain-containing protein [Gemmatimonadaceae bacterium]